MATRSSILVWNIPWAERGAWQAAVHGIAKESDVTEHWSAVIPWRGRGERVGNRGQNREPRTRSLLVTKGYNFKPEFGVIFSLHI